MTSRSECRTCWRRFLLCGQIKSLYYWRIYFTRRWPRLDLLQISNLSKWSQTLFTTIDRNRHSTDRIRNRVWKKGIYQKRKTLKTKRSLTVWATQVTSRCWGQVVVKVKEVQRTVLEALYETLLHDLRSTMAKIPYLTLPLKRLSIKTEKRSASTSTCRLLSRSMAMGWVTNSSNFCLCYWKSKLTSLLSTRIPRQRTTRQLRRKSLWKIKWPRMTLKLVGSSVQCVTRLSKILKSIDSGHARTTPSTTSTKKRFTAKCLSKFGPRWCMALRLAKVCDGKTKVDSTKMHLTKAHLIEACQLDWSIAATKKTCDILWSNTKSWSCICGVCI